MILWRAQRARRRSESLVTAAAALTWRAELECRDARDFRYDAREVRSVRHLRPVRTA
jgi:hypothetical protein